MVCLAVTRGGWGDIWRFEDRDAADLHPLVQYGDAILTEALDITRQYNTLEIPRLLARLEDEDLRVSILSSIHPDLGLSDRVRLSRVTERCGYIWEAMLRLSDDPPSDPTRVLETIQTDRQLMIKESRMADTKNTAAAAAATDTKDKGKDTAAAPKTPRAPKYAETDTIVMKADKDGKKYGADNNPKRAGSAAHDRFSKLRDGMTVKQFVDGVGSQSAAFGDLDFGIKHDQLEVRKTESF